MRNELDRAVSRLAETQTCTQTLSISFIGGDKDSAFSSLIKLMTLTNVELTSNLQSAIMQAFHSVKSSQETARQRELSAALSTAEENLASLRKENAQLQQSLSKARKQSESEQLAQAKRNGHIATLTVGSLVASHNGYIGTIKFVGPVKFSTGVWVGLEMHRPATGSSNLAPSGQVGGKKYFACKPGHGLLLRAEDVHLASIDEEERVEAVRKLSKLTECEHHHDHLTLCITHRKRDRFILLLLGVSC